MIIIDDKNRKYQNIVRKTSIFLEIWKNDYFFKKNCIFFLFLKNPKFYLNKLLNNSHSFFSIFAQFLINLFSIAKAASG